LDNFDHFLTDFLFTIVVTSASSTFIILYFCQETTNSQTAFMDPDMITFYSFAAFTITALLIGSFDLFIELL